MEQRNVTYMWKKISVRLIMMCATKRKICERNILSLIAEVNVSYTSARVTFRWKQLPILVVLVREGY